MLLPSLFLHPTMDLIFPPQLVAPTPPAAQTFTAVVHREESLYVAECPEIGTVSQGSTIEEAVANLKEATQLFLEEFPDEGGGAAIERPFITTFVTNGTEA